MEIEEIEINNRYYPEKLKTINNPPEKLYVLGNKEILNEKGIAIVGSRNCTEEGKRNARLFAANIAKAGFTVISGMAKGIDGAAHIGALEVGGKTIAVLGNGPLYIFPPENKEIYEKILESGGAIVSEYPKNSPPESDKFRKRNRIVSRTKSWNINSRSIVKKWNFYYSKICKRAKKRYILYTKFKRK